TAADLIRSEIDKRTGKLQARELLDHFIQNYLPHQYENEPLGAPVFNRESGKPGFLKERTIPTMQEAIESGLTPKFPNAYDAAHASIAEHDRLLSTSDILRKAEAEGVVQRYTDKPDETTGTTTAPPMYSENGDRIVRLD